MNISYKDGSISGASRNKASLQENRITYIFNWSHSARCDLFDNVKYVCITDVRGDKGMMSRLADLDEYVDTLDSIIKSKGRVMVHCWYGKNRSVTHLIAYLMKYEGMTAVEANNLIKETRPQANPYWDVLEEYSQHLERLKEDEGVTR
jgi:protein-tyrosine phosphatase